jgi:hypothetical protein
MPGSRLERELQIQMAMPGAFDAMTADLSPRGPTLRPYAHLCCALCAHVPQRAHKTSPKWVSSTRCAEPAIKRIVWQRVKLRIPCSSGSCTNQNPARTHTAHHISVDAPVLWIHRVQVSYIPNVGEPDGDDRAELVWSPVPTVAGASSTLTDGTAPASGTAGAAAVLPLDPDGAFFRRWSSADLEYQALHALWKANGDAALADVALIQQYGDPSKSGGTLAQDAALGALLTTAVIEHRKDLTRAHHALNLRGTKITMNALQRWYYAQFRRDAETIALATAMDAEMDTDDGLDDNCALCGQRGLLLACDACSSVYHLACVGLKAVPEGDWKCDLCLNPPPRYGGTGPAASAMLGGGRGRGRGVTGPPSAPSSRGRGAAPFAAPPSVPAGRPAATNGGMPAAIVVVPVVPIGGSTAPKPVVPIGGSTAPKQQPPQQPAPASAPALPQSQPAGGGAAPAPRGDASSTQTGKRKADPDGASSSSSKRIFQTAEGRRYEQDIFTGAVTWLDPPTVSLLTPIAAADGLSAAKPGKGGKPK